ncbi:MAG: T9SS type A sorting domain-containing protein [Bacteroidota bacterium]
MRLLVLTGIMGSCLCNIQSQGSFEDWEYIPIIGDFVGAVDTDTAIWLLHRYGLLHWDRVQQRFHSYEGDYLREPFFNNRYVFSRNGEHYILGGAGLYQLQGGMWRNRWGRPGEPETDLSNFTAIVGTNEYGLLIKTSEGYIYTFDPENYTSWAEQSPWNINWWPNRSFLQTEDGAMWVWSAQRLVRWQDEVMEEFTVPVAGDSIIAAVPGADQYRWVLSDQHLSYYDEKWTNISLASLSDHPLTAHQVIDEHSIFLAFDAEVMTLRFADDQYQIIYQEEYLGHKRPGQQLFLANNGELWYMDHLLKQHHYFSSDWHLSTLGEHNWLPSDAQNSTHITTDREGRLWVCTRDRTVFYSGEEWYAAEEAYPGFPKGTAQLQFTTNGTPITFSPKISNNNELATLQRYQHGSWASYPLPDDGSGLSPADATKLLLDRDDNIWLYEPGSTVVFMWDRHSWITLSTADFPSRPVNFSSIAFDKDNNLLLSTAGSIIRHDRRTAESYTFSDLDIPCVATFHNKLVADDQDNFWYGGFGLCQWSFDQPGQAVELSPDLGNLFQFYGIYPFTENEFWVVAESSIFGQVTVGPNANGELVAAAHRYRPNAPDMGDVLEYDQQGRIWALTRKSISRFTRPDSNSPSSAPLDGKLRAYPNPSCCQVHLKWQSEDSSPAQLQLYNTQGQLVYDLVKQNSHLGPQQLVVPRGELPAGVYFAVLYQGSRTEMVKIIFE